MFSNSTQSHYIGSFLIWLGFLLSSMLVISCEDQPVQRDYPRVRTLEVTNITANSATFVAEVYDEGNVDISDHGFTWAISSPDVTSNERVFLGPFSGTGVYESVIGTTLKEGQTYEVCAFIKAGDYTVYGEKVRFMSLGSGAPEIKDFFPKSAGWGDTVSISGLRFSYLNFTDKILIDECICTPFFASDTLLKFVLPKEVVKPQNSLSVSILGNVATATEKLVFISPEIYSFSPLEGHWGDTITFTGRYLNFLGLLPTDGMLLNESLLNRMINQEANTASCLISEQLSNTTSTVSVRYGPLDFSFQESFTLLSPEIDSLNPVEGTWGSRVTLYGRFNSLTERNHVYFGNTLAGIVSSTNNLLVVTVPDNLLDLVSKISYSSEPFSILCEEEFKLLAPEIDNFEPKEGYAGTLIAITGRNFKKDMTTVEVGGSQAYIRSISDTLITCHIPGDVYGPCTVSVKTLSQITVSDLLFNATNHIIAGVAPLQVGYGDTVTIKGSDFRPGIAVFLNQSPVSLASVDDDEIKFVVPFWMNYDPYNVTVKYEFKQTPYTIISSATSPDQLKLKDFTITDVTPLSGKAGDLITITGTNFGEPVVMFGSSEAQVTAFSRTEIAVLVPGLSTGEHSISVINGGRTHVYDYKYTHSGPWARLEDLPFLFDYGCVFDFGEDIFIVTAGDSETLKRIFKFNTEAEEFEPTGGSFSSAIPNPISCVSDGRGYILGLKEGTSIMGFEVFNPDSMTWHSLPDYPGNAKMSPCFFADDSVIYAGGGVAVSGRTTYIYTDFWKFSPATNKWTRLADTPYVLYSNQIFIRSRLLIVAGYFTIQPSVVEYFPLTNKWSVIAPFVSGNRHNGISQYLNDSWYIGFGDDVGYHYSPTEVWSLNWGSVYRFDLNSNTWSELQYVPVSGRSMVLSFTAGGYLYIGGDQIYHLYDFWRYDPQLDD